MTAAERESLIAALTTATKSAWVPLARDADRVQMLDGRMQVSVYSDGRAAVSSLMDGLSRFPRPDGKPYTEPGWPARLVADIVAFHTTVARLF